MKSLPALRQESTEIQTKIKSLLLENYRYDQGLEKQLDVIETVASLRQNLVSIQKEVKRRLSA